MLTVVHISQSTLGTHFLVLNQVNGLSLSTSYLFHTLPISTLSSPPPTFHTPFIAPLHQTLPPHNTTPFRNPCLCSLTATISIFFPHSLPFSCLLSLLPFHLFATRFFFPFLPIPPSIS